MSDTIRPSEGILSTIGDMTVRHITRSEDFVPLVPSLSRLLQSCVNPDPKSSSLGFRAPLSETVATTYWENLASRLFGPGRDVSLLVVTHDSPTGVEVVGTIQLGLNPKETHVHKAEIIKLLVGPESRRKGLGRILMTAAENFACEELGKTMLILDTATKTPARDFYLRLGYTEWGICPSYAQNADGKLDDCSFFLKFLEPPTAPEHVA